MMLKFDENNKQMYNIKLHENKYRKCNKINMLDFVKFKKNNKQFDKTFNSFRFDFKMNKSNFYSNIKLNKIKI